MKKIHESTFIINGNGFADGPSQALREYLISQGAQRVVTISHPLVAESEGFHVVEDIQGRKKMTKKFRFINRPPYTYVADPLIPMRLPTADVWFGFNNLAAARGLVRKKTGKVKQVVYWAVDFVPQRFGNSIVTSVYDSVDKYVCKTADLRIDLSLAALNGRTKHHKLSKTTMAEATVVPMGAWLRRTPKTTARSWNRKKIVYLGHLVERQGVENLLRAAKIIIAKDASVSVEIIGGGPLADNLRNLAKELGIASNVTFHGFVKSHEQVEAILAGGTVAGATYKKDAKSFTQFADPGKLKAYLGAGLPIVLTDVPPNAKELADAGVALVAEDNPKAIAKEFEKLLQDNDAWQVARSAVNKMAKQFDWDNILKKVLTDLGYE